MLEKNPRPDSFLTFWNLNNRKEEPAKVVKKDGKNPCLKGTGYDDHLIVDGMNDGQTYIVSFNSDSNRWEGWPQ